MHAIPDWKKCIFKYCIESPFDASPMHKLSYLPESYSSSHSIFGGYFACGPPPQFGAHLNNTLEA